MMINLIRKIIIPAIALTVILVFAVIFPVSAIAAITGVCSNCHTMHNSQNGEDVVAGGPNDVLLTDDCLGCHSNTSAQKVVTIGTSKIPQVLHNSADGDANELAGGNFNYLTKYDATRGHNVVDVTGVNGDPILDDPPGSSWPGGVHEFEQFVTDSNLTCAGNKGCHGLRYTAEATSNLAALKGAHHSNITTDSTSGFNTDGNSYRFLRGVQGHENDQGSFPWENKDATNHNEYYGKNTPPTDDGNCSKCHSNTPAPNIIPPQGTISGFCGTCHMNFHLLNDGVETERGIGSSINSPFQRHPTDVVLPGAGTEYDAYDTYKVSAPVARGVVPDSISSVVQRNAGVTGGIVMCLSCHKSHASQYPDMLRFDYTGMLINQSGTGAGEGCFACHTTKDGI